MRFIHTIADGSDTTNARLFHDESSIHVSSEVVGAFVSRDRYYIVT